MENPYLPIEATIEDVVEESPTIKTFVLRPKEAIPFETGQFIELTVPGLGEGPFTPSSSPTEKQKMDVTVMSVGKVTSKLHDMKQGERVYAQGVSEEDLIGYYNLCDMFVNASSWEGYLNPEAYAFKKPIVAYGIPPHDETVEDGVTGVLVGRLTANRFADEIAGLLGDDGKRKALGLNGYVWAKRTLDYAVVAKRFVEALGT